MGLALAGVLALAAAFWLGAEWGGRTQIVTAYCLSAPGLIDCTENVDGTGTSFLVPRDVAWSDGTGEQSDGRPECLPPVGIGNIRVTMAYEAVEVNGYLQNIAVWVDCTTAEPVS